MGVSQFLWEGRAQATPKVYEYGVSLNPEEMRTMRVASGMGSRLNFGFSLEPCHLRFFLNLRLLFLAVLESGAPLSSSLEEAPYKCSV